MAALDKLDELVDDCARLVHSVVLTLDREPVAAQADRAAKAFAQRVEHAVADRGELGRNVVRDVKHLLHMAKCRRPTCPGRDAFGARPRQTCALFVSTIESGRRWAVP